MRLTVRSEDALLPLTHLARRPSGVHEAVCEKGTPPKLLVRLSREIRNIISNKLEKATLSDMVHHT